MFQSQAKTEVVELSYSYKWTLQNFSRFFNHLEEASPQFSFNGHEWHFEIYVELASMSVWLYSSQTYSYYALIKSQVSVLDSTGNIIHYQSEQFSCARQNHKVADVPKICLNEGLNPPEDSLIITIHFSLHKTITNLIETMPSEEEITVNVQKSICSKMLNMYDHKVQSDVTLRVQGDEINAHKIVLTAVSPVFAKMLQQDMSESAMNVVDIKDIKLATMKVLVDFIYSRVKLDYDFDTVMDLYYAADKYQILQLREICRQIISQYANKDNALQILQMADRHKDDSLKKMVMNFVDSNFKSCVKAGWWADFASQKSELFEELMHFIK